MERAQRVLGRPGRPVAAAVPGRVVAPVLRVEDHADRRPPRPPDDEPQVGPLDQERGRGGEPGRVDDLDRRRCPLDHDPLPRSHADVGALGVDAERGGRSPRAERVGDGAEDGEPGPRLVEDAQVLRRHVEPADFEVEAAVEGPERVVGRRVRRPAPERERRHGRRAPPRPAPAGRRAAPDRERADAADALAEAVDLVADGVAPRRRAASALAGRERVELSQEPVEAPRQPAVGGRVGREPGGAAGQHVRHPAPPVCGPPVCGPARGRARLGRRPPHPVGADRAGGAVGVERGAPVDLGGRPLERPDRGRERGEPDGRGGGGLRPAPLQRRRPERRQGEPGRRRLDLGAHGPDVGQRQLGRGDRRLDLDLGAPADRGDEPGPPGLRPEPDAPVDDAAAVA